MLAFFDPTWKVNMDIKTSIEKKETTLIIKEILNFIYRHCPTCCMYSGRQVKYNKLYIISTFTKLLSI